MIDQATNEKMMRLAEAFFDTAHDSEQIPISQDSWQKLQVLHPEGVQAKLDDSGEPISWVVAIPTDRALADQFVRKEISERALFERSVPRERYEALYLCAAFTLPEHRRRGLVTQLFRDAIQKMPLTEDAVLVAWPTSPEGKGLVEKLKGQTTYTVWLRA